MPPRRPLADLERHIGIEFRQRRRLEEAVTHSSFRSGQPESVPNRRLAFLGDAVLGLVVARLHFDTFPEYPRGKLTDLRKEVVNNERLAKVGEKLGLLDFLNTAGLRDDALPGLLSDATEALVGAIYMEHGFPAAARFVEEFVLPPG